MVAWCWYVHMKDSVAIVGGWVIDFEGQISIWALITSLRNLAVPPNHPLELLWIAIMHLVCIVSHKSGGQISPKESSSNSWALRRRQGIVLELWCFHSLCSKMPVKKDLRWLCHVKPSDALSWCTCYIRQSNSPAGMEVSTKVCAYKRSKFFFLFFALLFSYCLS